MTNTAQTGPFWRSEMAWRLGQFGINEDEAWSLWRDSLAEALRRTLSKPSAKLQEDVESWEITHEIEINELKTEIEKKDDNSSPAKESQMTLFS